MTNESLHVYSIAKLFQDQGLKTGIVTTTRVTHASPAGVYAHIAHRDWESDQNIRDDGLEPEECPDIAKQLVTGKVGKKLNVIFGGGRLEFLQNTTGGHRGDGVDLIEKWKLDKTGDEFNGSVISNRSALIALPATEEYVLGLFADDHLNYRLDPVETQPRLVEMTKKAIEILSHDKKGFFLFVEGGRIDHGHHDSLPMKALEETVEFHEAVKAAVEMVNVNDTLIVVTADHAHTMTVGGYPQRGSNILGFAARADDDLPYTTISYANGPGYREEKDGKRYNMTLDKTTRKRYVFPALVPLAEETHGGDDVGIYAIGPWAHLYSGVMEQNVIPHIMAYAACVKEGTNACSSSTMNAVAVQLLLFTLLVSFRRNFL